MSLRKTPLYRLARWSQIRRRGDAFLLVGRFEDGEVVLISVHDTLGEAAAHNLAYLYARERDGAPSLYLGRRNGEARA
jgi:hypothetical protein